MVEHQMLEVDDRGMRPFHWRSARFNDANNETLWGGILSRTLNWNLPKKMIRRALYIRAMEFLGREVCEMAISYAEDELHLTTMYRFVRKFVSVDYYGYVYYLNVAENSMVRETNRRKTLNLVHRLIHQMSQKVITVGLQD
jgi:hypothetical protein